MSAGQTVTFRVAATSTTPLQYQWQKSGTALAGATGSSYTTPATVSANNGSSYTVVVTNATGSVTSAAATLTVITALASLYVVAQILHEEPSKQGAALASSPEARPPAGAKHSKHHKKAGTPPGADAPDTANSHAETPAAGASP